MSNILHLYIMIRAIDYASMILRHIGLTGMGAFAPLVISAAAVGGAIAGVAYESLKAASSFDLYMTKVQALTVVTNQGNDNMAYYRQQILALSAQLGMSADQLAQGLYFVKSAGESGAEAINTLKYSAMTAKAGMVDLQGVADAVTSTLNAYKGAGYNAAQVTDMLHLAVVNGKMEWGDLVTSFGFTATTARAAGLSIQEVTSAVSALTAVAGHHGARRIQMELDNLMRSGIDIKAIEKRAKGLGLAFDAAKFASSSFIDKLKYLAGITGFSLTTLQKLRDASHGNEQEFEAMALKAAKANSGFMKMVGGAAAFIPAAILMSDKGKAYNAILQQMHTNGEVTTQSFMEMSQTLTQRLQSFKNQINSIGISIGEALMPTALAFGAWLNNTAGRLGAWLAQASNINAFKNALIGMSIVVTVILVPALIELLVTTAPMWGPFALAVGAIVVVGLLLGKVITALETRFGGWAGVMRQLAPIISVVRAAFQQAGAEIRHALADPAIQSALKQFQQSLPALIPLLKVIGLIVGGALVVGFHLFVAILDGLAGELPGILMFLTGLVNVLGGIGRVILDLFTNQSDLGAAFRQIGQGLVQVVGGMFLALYGAAAGFFGHFLSLFGTNGDKVKVALGNALTRAGAGIKTAVGGWFNGLGTLIHSRLVATGNNFSAFGTRVHAVLMAAGRLILDAILWPWRQLAALGHWLYQHNIYFHRAVDGWHKILADAGRLIGRAISGIKTVIHQQWTLIVSEARAAWLIFQSAVLSPVVFVVRAILTTIGDFVKGVEHVWQQLVTGAKRQWDALVAGLKRQAGLMVDAAKGALLDPILGAWKQIEQKLAHVGENLMKMIAQSIRRGASVVGDAAKSVLGNIAGWLGFRSPAPKAPESARWGANLVQMIARSMTSAGPQMSAAAMLLTRQLAQQFSGQQLLNAMNAAAHASSTALSAAARSGAPLAAGNTGTVNHTWNVTFPNAKDMNQIKQALTDLQQQDYRAARRAGGYGGLRAGIDTLT
jgi:TP901 family phage tail tape measure protein